MQAHDEFINKYPARRLAKFLHQQVALSNRIGQDSLMVMLKQLDHTRMRRKGKGKSHPNC